MIETITTKQFRGFSKEEKKEIESYKSMLEKDFAILCFNCDYIITYYEDNGILPILNVLEKYCPFVKEQKESIIDACNEDEEVAYEIVDFIESFIDITDKSDFIDMSFFIQAKKELHRFDFDYLLNIMFNEIKDGFDSCEDEVKIKTLITLKDYFTKK